MSASSKMSLSLTSKSIGCSKQLLCDQRQPSLLGHWREDKTKIWDHRPFFVKKLMRRNHIHKGFHMGRACRSCTPSKLPTTHRYLHTLLLQLGTEVKIRWYSQTLTHTHFRGAHPVVSCSADCVTDVSHCIDYYYSTVRTVQCVTRYHIYSLP